MCDGAALDALVAVVGQQLGSYPDGGDKDAVFAWRQEVFEVVLALDRLGHRDPGDEPTLSLLRAWHDRLEPPAVLWGDLIGEISAAWPAVQYTTRAFEQPDPRPLPQKARRFKGGALYERLINGCRNMGRGGATFNLGCRDAAKLLGMNGLNDYMQANRMLNALTAAGLLEVTNKGSMKRVPGKKCMTATTWRWIGDD